MLTARLTAHAANRRGGESGGGCSAGGGDDGASMGEGIRNPAADHSVRASRAPRCSDVGRAGAQKRISAMTSAYSVSPTGVKPTRWKNASGPPVPAS